MRTGRGVGERSRRFRVRDVLRERRAPPPSRADDSLVDDDFVSADLAVAAPPVCVAGLFRRGADDLLLPSSWLLRSRSALRRERSLERPRDRSRLLAVEPADLPPVAVPPEASAEPTTALRGAGDLETERDLERCDRLLVARRSLVSLLLADDDDDELDDDDEEEDELDREPELREDELLYDEL